MKTHTSTISAALTHRHNQPMSASRRSAAPAGSSEAPEAHFVDDYLPALLAQASQLISGEFHRVVTSHGFAVSEWRVLATLHGNEPMSIGSLAQTTTIKQPTVTRLL